MEKKKIREDIGESVEFNAENPYHEYSINIGDERTFDKETSVVERIYLEDKNNHTPIDEILDWILAAKKAGATHIDWFAKCDYEGSSELVEAQAFKERDENELELFLRTQKELRESAKRKEDKEADEREQYEKLKAKFEK